MNRTIAMLHRQLVRSPNSATSSLLLTATSRLRTSSQKTLHCSARPLLYNNGSTNGLTNGSTCTSCVRRTYATSGGKDEGPAEQPKEEKGGRGSPKGGENFVPPSIHKQDTSRKVPMTWKQLYVFLVVGGAGLFYVKNHMDQEFEKIEAETKRSVGKPMIGGPFELQDTKGNTVTDKTFLGKWLFIYFGFCNCPDICPDQLEKITEIVNRVNKFAEDNNFTTLTPIYVTVDPNRDTPDIIEEYLEDFHPDFIGLTGSSDQIKAVCKAYRIYYSEGPKDEDEDYIVDHSVISYLVAPNGDFEHYFGIDKGIDETKNEIIVRMKTKQL